MSKLIVKHKAVDIMITTSADTTRHIQGILSGDNYTNDIVFVLEGLNERLTWLEKLMFGKAKETNSPPPNTPETPE